MDDILTPETVSNALQIRKHETYQESHIRRAIEAAENCASTKARVSVDVLRDMLPKAHRVSS